MIYLLKNLKIIKGTFYIADIIWYLFNNVIYILLLFIEFRGQI